MIVSSTKLRALPLRDRRNSKKLWLNSSVQKQFNFIIFYFLGSGSTSRIWIPGNGKVIRKFAFQYANGSTKLGVMVTTSQHSQMCIKLCMEAALKLGEIPRSLRSNREKLNPKIWCSSILSYIDVTNVLGRCLLRSCALTRELWHGPVKPSSMLILSRTENKESIKIRP